MPEEHLSDARRSGNRQAVLPAAVSPPGEGFLVHVAKVCIDEEQIRRRGFSAHRQERRLICGSSLFPFDVRRENDRRAAIAIVDAIGNGPAWMRHGTLPYMQAADLHSTSREFGEFELGSHLLPGDRPIRLCQQSRDSVTDVPIGKGRPDKLERPVRSIEQRVHRQPGHVVQVVMGEHDGHLARLHRSQLPRDGPQAGAGVEHQSLASRSDEQQRRGVAAELIEAAPDGRPTASHSADEESQAHFSVNPHTPSHNVGGWAHRSAQRRA